MGFNKMYLPELEDLKKMLDKKFLESIKKVDVFVGPEKSVEYINNYIKEQNG